MSDLVVDTDVVSYGFRQTDLFVQKYGPVLQGNRAIISFMTVAEIEYGMLKRGWGTKNQQAMQAYLSQHYIRYGVSDEVCNAWAELVWKAQQQGRVLQGSDAWIAATAKVLGVPLVTHNKKDFEYLSLPNLITFENQ